MTQAETILQQEILLALGTKPYCRVWRNQTGALPDPKTGRWIRFGVKGSPDIEGILITGRWLGVEVKTYKGTLSKDQIRFKNMIEAFGGLYILARRVEDAILTIEGSLNVVGRGGYQKGVQQGEAARSGIGGGLEGPPVRKIRVPLQVLRRPARSDGQ